MKLGRGATWSLPAFLILSFLITSKAVLAQESAEM